MLHRLPKCGRAQYDYTEEKEYFENVKAKQKAIKNMSSFSTLHGRYKGLSEKRIFFIIEIRPFFDKNQLQINYKVRLIK